MGREYPEFSYSGLSDPSDVLLRQEPEEEEDEEKEDDDKDDDDEERGFRASPQLLTQRIQAATGHNFGQTSGGHCPESPGPAALPVGILNRTVMDENNEFSGPSSLTHARRDQGSLLTAVH